MIDQIKYLLSLVIKMGSTFSIIFFSLIFLLALQIIGLVLPSVLNFIDFNNVVSVMTLVVLTELLFLNINRDSVASKVSENESVYISEITKDTQIGKIKEVLIISSGLSSRYLFIAELIKNKIKVKILVQGDTVIGDSKDLQRLPSMIKSIDISTKENTADYLEIRGNASITSVRAIIVHYKDNKTKSILSWYTYDKDHNILGHTNPAIFADDDTHDNQILSSFVCDKFESNWSDAESNILFPLKGNIS